MDIAMFGLTESPTDDRRFVEVESVGATVATCVRRALERPQATTVLRDVLTSFRAHEDVHVGIVTESLAYSTLQSGREFDEWLAVQKPRSRHEQDDPVLLDRVGGSMSITFDRPDRHNAFSDALRQGLLSGLHVALADTSVTRVHLKGNGPSFCSGGDLREFGLFDDPASSHLARLEHSPAILLDRLARRLGTNLVAEVHGAVLGSGLEMASFCGTVVAKPDAVFGLPELTLGLIPGAGGTVSVSTRIGTSRTCYLVLSGAQLDAGTAADWGLADVVEGG